MARDADATVRPQSRVTTSLTAELIFAANLVASSADRVAFEPGWVDRQRAQMDAKALAFVSRVQGFWWPTLGVVDFLCYNGAYDDPKAFCAATAAVPIEQFVEVLFNGDLDKDQVRSLLARPEKAAELGENLCQFSGGYQASRVALFRDPEGHRAGLLALILAADTPLFRQTWADWNRAAAPSLRLIETALVGQDPFTVAESMRKKPVSGPRQFDRFVFIPSRLIAHKHIRSWGAGTYLFFIQEGGIALPGLNQGTALAEFLKVLGDPTRMDILRLLSTSPSYGKEIAASLNLTTATVSRHLDQLKAAGLVSEDRADAHNVKRLRYVPESLESQLERLKTYLLHS